MSDVIEQMAEVRGRKSDIRNWNLEIRSCEGERLIELIGRLVNSAQVVNPIFWDLLTKNYEYINLHRKINACILR